MGLRKKNCNLSDQREVLWQRYRKTLPVNHYATSIVLYIVRDHMICSTCLTLQFANISSLACKMAPLDITLLAGEFEELRAPFIKFHKLRKEQTMLSFYHPIISKVSHANTGHGQNLLSDVAIDMFLFVERSDLNRPILFRFFFKLFSPNGSIRKWATSVQIKNERKLATQDDHTCRRTT